MISIDTDGFQKHLDLLWSGLRIPEVLEEHLSIFSFQD